MIRNVYNKDGELIGTETVYEEEMNIESPENLDDEEFDDLYCDHGW